MRRRSIFLLLSMLVISAGFAQDTSYVTNYLIGETEVAIHSQRFHPHPSKVIFINLHDNEQTAIKAVQAYLTACGGGTLVKITNDQERFIDICLSGKAYRFDPNRIYSEGGRKYTLTKLSSEFNDTVENAVQYLADQILKHHLAGSRLVVAVHNNTDSLLSIESYQQEQARGKHFGDVFINPEMDPDDFILTTNSLLFKKIKERNINVVWENARMMTNDGSLSIYAGLHKIPYINIEAEHDHAEEQLMMLNALDDIIKEYSRKKSIKKITSRSNLSPKNQPKIFKHREVCSQYRGNPSYLCVPISQKNPCKTNLQGLSALAPLGVRC